MKRTFAHVAQALTGPFIPPTRWNSTSDHMPAPSDECQHAQQIASMLTAIVCKSPAFHQTMSSVGASVYYMCSLFREHNGGDRWTFSFGCWADNEERWVHFSGPSVNNQLVWLGLEALYFLIRKRTFIYSLGHISQPSYWVHSGWKTSTSDSSRMTFCQEKGSLLTATVTRTGMNRWDSDASPDTRLLLWWRKWL